MGHNIGHPISDYNIPRYRLFIRASGWRWFGHGVQFSGVRRQWSGGGEVVVEGRRL
jgi:hypothetical protein